MVWVEEWIMHVSTKFLMLVRTSYCPSWTVQPPDHQTFLPKSSDTTFATGAGALCKIAVVPIGTFRLFGPQVGQFITEQDDQWLVRTNIIKLVEDGEFFNQNKHLWTFRLSEGVFSKSTIIAQNSKYSVSKDFICTKMTAMLILLLTISRLLRDSTEKVTKGSKMKILEVPIFYGFSDRDFALRAGALCKSCVGGAHQIGNKGK